MASCTKYVVDVPTVGRCNGCNLSAIVPSAKMGSILGTASGIGSWQALIWMCRWVGTGMTVGGGGPGGGVGTGTGSEATWET